ncbi:MAG: HAD-IA family hydrolase [Candidatus Micrarchaeota archaeon]
MLKAILFDLDNTLIDFMRFKRETAKAAAKAMVEKGLPDTVPNVYRKIFQTYDRYGIEYQKTFYRVVKSYRNRKLETGNREHIQQAAIIAYLKRKFSVLRSYPSVKPVLEKLGKRFRLGIVTDAPRNKAWQRLVLCGLDGMFEFVVTADDAGKKKPHRAPFRMALERVNVEPSEVLFVGDNPGRDMEGAKRMGMKTCLAEYGLAGRGKRGTGNWMAETRKVSASYREAIQKRKTGRARPDYRIRGFGELDRILK